MKNKKNIHSQQLPKYPEVILTKEVKDFYNENVKTLKREIEEDTRIWTDLQCSCQN